MSGCAPAGSIVAEQGLEGLAPPRVGFIIGPTGIGKTAFSIRIAERLNAEILNADSRQLYRGMDIGTAKPGAAERARVPHHLVDIREPDQPLDVAQFAEMAHQAIAQIVARGRPVLVTGGSGLYLRVLRQGIFKGPGASPAIRKQLAERAAQQGPEWLYSELRRVDPDAAGRLEPRDAYRIIRALEVFHLTGVPISEHQRRHRLTPARYQTMTIGLELSRERLYGAIDRRFSAMVEQGLVEEVRRLLALGLNPGTPPLSAVGYKQITAFLRGECTLQRAVELAQRDSRRLAKRQLTWFRREPGVVWVDAETGTERAVEIFREFFDGGGIEGSRECLNA